MLLTLLAHVLPSLRNPPQHLLVYMDCIQAAVCRAFRHNVGGSCTSLTAHQQNGDIYGSSANMSSRVPVPASAAASEQAEASQLSLLLNQAVGMSLQDSFQHLVQTAMSIVGSPGEVVAAASGQSSADSVSASRKDLLRRCQGSLVQLLLNVVATALMSSPLELDFSMPSATRFDLGPLPPMQHLPAYAGHRAKSSTTPAADIASGSDAYQDHAASQSRHLPQNLNSVRPAAKPMKGFLQPSLAHQPATTLWASELAAFLLKQLGELRCDPAAVLLPHARSAPKPPDIDNSLSVPEEHISAATIPHSAAASVLIATDQARSSGYSTDVEDVYDGCDPSIQAPGALEQGEEQDSSSVASQEQDEGPGAQLGAALALLCTLACPPAKGLLQRPTDAFCLLEAAAEGSRLLLDSAAEHQVTEQIQCHKRPFSMFISAFKPNLRASKCQ